ncbi:MAG TPA: ABC transporter permease [Solirubrobacterales bacterium]|nr:ABC transporter permease [Solirubrobacterales bacterium]
MSETSSATPQPTAVPSSAPTPPGAGEARNQDRARDAWRRFLALEELGPLLALAALVILIGGFHSEFTEKTVLLNTLRSASFVAITAYGMVYLLAMTEIDLSVGGIYALSIMLAAKWMAHIDPFLAALLAILVAVLMGAVNGLLANIFRIPVIIITLGTLSMYRGLVQIVSDGKPATGIPLQSSFFSKLGGETLGLPTAAWFVLGLGVILTFVFRKTRFGAMVRATGSNHQAAEFSGIPTRRIRLYALMLVGGLAGLAGVLSLAYFQGADPTIGAGYELQVIAAAIIGGTAVSGGTGTVPGALIGALIVAVINSGLIFFSINSNWTNFVTGAVIVIAVGSDALIRRRRAARAVRAGV